MQLVPSLGFGSGDKVLRVQSQADTVIFRQVPHIDIELSMPGNRSQVQEFRFLLYTRNAATPLLQYVRHLCLPVIKPDIRKLELTVSPYVLIDHNVVLSVRSRNRHISDMAEIGDSCLVRRRLQKNENQK